MKLDRLSRVPVVLMALAGIVASAPAWAGDPPDAALNPSTGAIEVIDVVLTGAETRIRYVARPADGGEESTVFLTTGETEDLDPKVEITADGTTWVVWWRQSETPQVLYRYRVAGNGEWSDEASASDVAESAHSPHLACDGSTVWLVYESDAEGGTSIIVKRTDDGPEPFPLGFILATTGFTGDRDVRVQTESGRVWVTWVDSETEVRWSEFDAASSGWSAPRIQEYVDSTVADARAAIRTVVLGE